MSAETAEIDTIEGQDLHIDTVVEDLGAGQKTDIEETAEAGAETGTEAKAEIGAEIETAVEIGAEKDTEADLLKVLHDGMCSPLDLLVGAARGNHLMESEWMTK